jgi:NAD(P)-dependent dehydrogenase (short-subunit alcohol dehydrogenase family)
MGPPLVWLVTGCSSGFGEQFIRSILARGDKAIATGRDASRLNALKEAGAAVLELDIAAEQPALVAKIQEAIGVFRQYRYPRQQRGLCFGWDVRRPSMSMANRLSRPSSLQQSSLLNMIH